MQHIDLFEAPDGDFYMVPDEGDTVYGHWAEATSENFASVARSLIENEDGYREGYGNIHRYTSAAKLLADPATIHLADYTAGEEDTSTRYREDHLHLYGQPATEEGITFLGTVCAYLARKKQLPPGPMCGRCIDRMHLIGINDVPPWGSHLEVQHTIMYQCPSCGFYRQTGFEEGGDWTGEKLSFRKWVRLLPDPYRKNGRLRMTYEADGRRLNLDGDDLHLGWSLEVEINGTYQRGRIETDSEGRFYLTERIRSQPDIHLLPGMRARQI